MAPESGQPVPHAPTQPYSQQQTYAAPAPDGTQPPTEKKPRNILGLIALIVAGIGFIFACIPGALVVGWILLPIAFILALVSLFLPGKGKGLGVAALIVSIVGTIIGFVVFFTVVGNAFNDAFNDDTTVVEQPAEQPASDEDDTAAEEEPAAAEEGTRENPYPLGTKVSSDEWEVTVNSVTFAANDAVANANQFNEAPPEGSEYILINTTITYVGSDADGGMPAFVTIAYVTPTGETVDLTDSFAVAPEPLDTMTTLYNGGTVTGNVVLAVPSADAQAGAIAVQPGMLADKVFYAVQ